VETRSPHVLQTMRIPLSMSAFGSNVILINDRNKLAISIETAGVDRPIAPLLRSNCGCVLRHGPDAVAIHTPSGGVDSIP
jgi:hypothetical protein